MIHYIDFYIDIDTYEIHRSDCSHLSTNKVYLGIFRGLEIALTTAISKGFTKANVCNSCNILS